MDPGTATRGMTERLAQPLLQARVGVIAPSANPSVEIEVRAALPERMGMHATRLPRHDGLDLAGRLAAYRDDITAAVASFGSLSLRAILFGCTGSSYPIGLDGDRALAGSVTGVDIVTAAGAVRDLLASLGIRRIHLVTPYPEWLTAQCVNYWNEAGYPVEAVTPVIHRELYRTTDDDTYRAIAATVPAAERSTGAAVLVAGTGAASLRALDAACAHTDIALLSSNVAGAVRLAQLSGWRAVLRHSRHAVVARLANRMAGPAGAA